MTRTQICECGHVNHMHDTHSCRACPCRTFTEAADPEAAILTGMERKRGQVAAANARRANYREDT